VKRLEDERIMQHAETTRSIYEDVSKTLREENKKKRAIMKRELEEQLKEREVQIENTYQAIIAKER
jgi:hypothetical protein